MKKAPFQAICVFSGLLLTSAGWAQSSGMDHSGMDHSSQGGQMDHSNMPHGGQMDHSNMPHGGHMDHSNMSHDEHMDHSGMSHDSGSGHNGHGVSHSMPESKEGGQPHQGHDGHSMTPAANPHDGHAMEHAGGHEGHSMPSVKLGAWAYTGRDNPKSFREGRWEMVPVPGYGHMFLTRTKVNQKLACDALRENPRVMIDRATQKACGIALPTQASAPSTDHGHAGH